MAKPFLRASILLAFMLLSAESVQAAVNLTVEQGPHGGDRVITPWGDYIVVTRSDGSVWVGTEEEYDRSRADAISSDMGMKPAMVGGKRTYVSTTLPTLIVGSLQLSNVSTDILFGVGPNDYNAHRPRKSVGYEYVSISWTQSERGAIKMLLVDKPSGRTIQPYECAYVKEISGGYCEFLVNSTQLKDQVMAIFLKQGTKPSALPAKALTLSAYAALKDKLRHGVTPDADDRASMDQLMKLDPSINEEIEPHR